MKKLFRLAAFVLTGMLAQAQQALWGGSQLVSPEIHDNNTVTFRLKAPKLCFPEESNPMNNQYNTYRLKTDSRALL